MEVFDIEKYVNFYLQEAKLPETPYDEKQRILRDVRDVIYGGSWINDVHKMEHTSTIYVSSPEWISNIEEVNDFEVAIANVKKAYKEYKKEERKFERLGRR